MGQPGHDCEVVKDPQGIMHITKKAVSHGEEVVGCCVHGKKRNGGNQSSIEMDISMACILLCKCIPAQQDIKFDNPTTDPPCTCETCQGKPHPSHPKPCNCSKCLSEILPPMKSKQRCS